MKKPSWADITVILLSVSLLFVSCAETSQVAANENVSTAIALAEQLTESGYGDVAVEIYSIAANQSDDYRLLYNQALTLAKLGRYEEAQELCRSSIEKYPYIISFRKALAQYLLSDGKTEQAIEEYESILIISPYDFEIMKKVMNLCHENGYGEKAYSTALRLWSCHEYSKETAMILAEYNPEIWSDVLLLLE